MASIGPCLILMAALSLAVKRPLLALDTILVIIIILLAEKIGVAITGELVAMAGKPVAVMTTIIVAPAIANRPLPKPAILAMKIGVVAFGLLALITSNIEPALTIMAVALPLANRP